MYLDAELCWLKNIANTARAGLVHIKSSACEKKKLTAGGGCCGAVA